MASRDMSAFDLHIDCRGSNNNIGDIVGQLWGQW